MPKERVAILQDAMRKAFKDSEFQREYKKLTGDGPDPLMPGKWRKPCERCRATPRRSIG
jgi:hypothetical protein